MSRMPNHRQEEILEHVWTEREEGRDAAAGDHVYTSEVTVTSTASGLVAVAVDAADVVAVAVAMAKRDQRADC